MQVDCSALPCLQLLSVNAAALDAAAYEPLTFLPALKHLVLWHCPELPTCLARLSALCALRIFYTPREWVGIPGDAIDGRAAALEAALAPLSGQLTSLELSCSYLSSCPATLPAFHRLEGLVFHPEDNVPVQLPTGPWLRKLRWAIVDAQTAAASMVALATATQLESLVLRDTSTLDAIRPALLAVLSWAPQHSSLRHLEIDHVNISGSWDRSELHARGDPAIQAAIVQARRANPFLCAVCDDRLWCKLVPQEFD